MYNIGAELADVYGPQKSNVRIDRPQTANFIKDSNAGKLDLCINVGFIDVLGNQHSRSIRSCSNCRTLLSFWLIVKLVCISLATL